MSNNSLKQNPPNALLLTIVPFAKINNVVSNKTSSYPQHTQVSSFILPSPISSLSILTHSIPLTQI